MNYNIELKYIILIIIFSFSELYISCYLLELELLLSF